MSELSIAKLLIGVIYDFIERDFMEQEVKTEIIGDTPPVLTVEGYIELKRGAEYMLPRRIAYDLARKGIARIKDEEITMEYLSKIVYNEESSKNRIQLYRVQPYLYSLARKTIEDLRKRLESEGRIELYEEYRDILELYSSLISLRLGKIINMLRLPIVPQELLDKMTEEEKMLFSILRTTLKEWEKRIGLERIE